MKLNSVAKAVVAKQIQALVKQMRAQDSDNQNAVPPRQDLKDGNHLRVLHKAVSKFDTDGQQRATMVVGVVGNGEIITQQNLGLDQGELRGYDPYPVQSCSGLLVGCNDCATRLRQCLQSERHARPVLEALVEILLQTSVHNAL